MREEISEIRRAIRLLIIRKMRTEKIKSEKNAATDGGSLFFSRSLRGFAVRYKSKPAMKGESNDKMKGKAAAIIITGISIIIMSRHRERIVLSFTQITTQKNR